MTIESRNAENTDSGVLHMTRKRTQAGQQSAITRRKMLQGIGGVGIAFAGLALPGASLPDPGEPARAARAPNRRWVHAVISLNQVGYLPADAKLAVIAATGELAQLGFAIVDDAVVPKVRFQGKLGRSYEPVQVGATFQVYYRAVFDALDKTGRYRLRLADGRLSEPFSVGRDAYHELIPLVLQYFDAQQCGKHRSKAHGPCHLDDGIAVGGPRDGQHVDASGGWHDAGDYMKFVETTSYVAALLATTCERYLQMPLDAAAKTTVGALLAHTRVGLEWLLKMHPTPDEFYFQVGSEDDHDTWRVPEDDVTAVNTGWKPRTVHFGVGANLAGRTAAALAVAARLYAREDKAFATQCLRTAESAYRLGLKTPTVLSTLPADFYPEKTWEDDMEWGAAQLYITTKRKEYLDEAISFSKTAGHAGEVPSVYSANAEAHLALYPHVSASDKERLLGYIRADAEAVRKTADNPYSLGTPLIWGTAEGAAGAGLLCWTYGKLSGDASYLALSRRQRDFILGCNPWSISFLVGAGSRYPLYPHHQIANIRGIELTGALVGGPTSVAIFKEQKITLNETGFGSQLESPPLEPDTPTETSVYHDSVEDYVTNEPANDYTAKFLLLAALDAFSA